MSVSYTHLDVYKRQVLIGPYFVHKLLRRCIVNVIDNILDFLPSTAKCVLSLLSASKLVLHGSIH